ncbi:hypothetical protein IKG_05637, partial [Bacillus cereus VD200]
MSSTEDKNNKNEMMKKIGLTVAMTTLSLSTLSGCFDSEKITSTKYAKNASEKKDDKKEEVKKDEQQDTDKNEFLKVAEKAINTPKNDQINSVAFLDGFDTKKDKKLNKDKEFKSIAMDAKDKSVNNLTVVNNNDRNLVFVSDKLTPNDDALIASIEPAKVAKPQPNPDVVINPPVVNVNNDKRVDPLAEPEKPTKPEKPTESEKPTEPGKPTESEKPTEPGKP